MERNNPKVSVITVTLNCVKTIRGTIESVLEQNYSNIEYIVKDGGSSDGTWEVVKDYPQIRAVMRSDKGIFDSMNQALEMASGEWVIFMNSGDRFYSPKVISDIFNDNIREDVGVVYGKTLANNKVMPLKPFYRCSDGKFREMGICHQSIFVRTSLAIKFKFDTSYKIAADYNMMMSIYNSGYKFVGKDIVVSVFDTNGFSTKNSIAQIKEVAKICHAEKSLGKYYALVIESIRIVLKKII